MSIPRTAPELLGAAWNVTKIDLIVTTLLLAAALLLAALILKLVDRWRKQRGDEVQSQEDQLAHFQQLHWKGELSKEEFERIQALLGAQIRKEEAPPKPAAPPLPTEGTQPPPAHPG
jgi:hypothetical protein